MKFVVSRFERLDGKWQPTRDIGYPNLTREEAEKKLSETRKSFEVFVRARHFDFGIREISDTPAPEQPPLAKECAILARSGNSCLLNYTCPICKTSRRVGLDNVLGPGNQIIVCECGEKTTLHLQFDISEAPDKPQPVQQGVQTTPAWLKSWNPKFK